MGRTMPRVSTTTQRYLQEHPEYAACRRHRRHFWPEEGVLTPLKGGADAEHFRCEKCGAEKTEYIDRWGNLFAPTKRTYPEGYLLHGERIETSDLRLLRALRNRERRLAMLKRVADFKRENAA